MRTDQVNCTLAIDNKLAKLWETLAPHTNIFMADEPRRISENIAIPKTCIATFSNWMSSEDEMIDPIKQNRFNQLPFIN
jgi:hypothetical protein